MLVQGVLHCRLIAEKISPAIVHMAVETHCLILRQDKKSPEPAVQTIRQRKIDDSIRPAKRNGRLGSIASQRLKSRPFTTSQNDGEYIFHGLSHIECIM